MRVIWAGSFEPEFNRNRKLVRLFDLIGAEVDVVRVQLWGTDRIDLASTGKVNAVARLALGIPRLLWRLLRRSTPDLYFVSYPGWFDMPAVWLVAKIKRRPIVFDPFISLYDTLVVDRGIYSASSWIGRVAKTVDRLAFRLANVVLADTSSHLEYFDSISPGVRQHGDVLPLGADDSVFFPLAGPGVEQRTVLFYGTFVPLQGATTVIDAARILERDGIRFVLIGDGQDRPLVEKRIQEHDVKNVELLGLIPMSQLPHHISKAMVCLGIFGQSPKAGRVVPNKVYECVAMGQPVVTRASDAIDEAFPAGEVVTIPPGDPDALAKAIRAIIEDADRREGVARAGRHRYEQAFHEVPLSRRFACALNSV